MFGVEEAERIAERHPVLRLDRCGQSPAGKLAALPAVDQLEALLEFVDVRSVGGQLLRR